MNWSTIQICKISKGSKMVLTARLGFSPFLLTGMSSSSEKYHTSNIFVTIKSPLNPLSYLSAISPPKSNGDSDELEEEMH